MDGVKYGSNSTKLHKKMSLMAHDSPLLRPVQAIKFSAHCSVVRYGAPSVFIDELWYADEMVARVSKTENTCLEIEVFNPKGQLALGKLMAADSLISRILLSPTSPSRGNSRHQFSHFRSESTGYTELNLFQSVYSANGQYANTDMYAFKYKYTGVPQFTSQSSTQLYYNNYANNSPILISYNSFHLRVAKRLERGVVFVQRGLGSHPAFRGNNKTFTDSCKITCSVESVVQPIINYSQLMSKSFSKMPTPEQRVSPVVAMAVTSIECDGKPVSINWYRERYRSLEAGLHKFPSIFLSPSPSSHGSGGHKAG